MSRPGPRHAARGGLTVAALGIVFGDIGTSPLYTVQTVFARDALRALPADAVAVYGIASLIVWTIVLVVLVKYVALIMRADNDGEGGIMALVSLLVREQAGDRRLGPLVLLGIAGAALFLGDSLITPAISVLSAVEGLELVDPGLKPYVVPVAIAIIVALFAIQRAGTRVVGRWFGPIMLVWFVAIGLWGLRGVADDPSVLRALGPTYAIDFFRADALTAFLSLGAVVLAVTGAEALYADLGHFGVSPIRRAWLFAVFPALILSYLGQSALIRNDPGAVERPFFALVPHWALLPMVLLATVATVIASQAVISGAFSLARQASRLGYLPSLDIRHTSTTDPGQVYVPVVNAVLLVGVLVLVVGFGSSTRLASAYGLAVTGTMLVTAVLFFARALRRRRRSLAEILPAAAFVLTVDFALLGASMVKIPKGGWLPLAVGVGAFAVMANWHAGHLRLERRRRAQEPPIDAYVEDLSAMGRSLHRVPGTAIFLARPGDTTTAALRAVAERVHALHRHVLIVTVDVAETPRVAQADRVTVDGLGLEHDGIVRVRLHFGFDDSHSVPEALRQASDMYSIEGRVDLDDATYFVSTATLQPTAAGGLASLRQRLYLLTARLATDPVRYYDLPSRQTVLVGQPLALD